MRKISFTGSSATGKKVMAGAAETLKRITLELGGNDAGIVLDDVNPKTAAQGIFDGAFQNSGQVCIAMKRLYVHESIYDEMCDELLRRWPRPRSSATAWNRALRWGRCKTACSSTRSRRSSKTPASTAR